MSGRSHLHALFRDSVGSTSSIPCVGDEPTIGVVDLECSHGTVLLSNRLRAIPLDEIPDIVVFRDATRENLDEIALQTGASVQEIFPGARAAAIVTGGVDAQLDWIWGSGATENTAKTLDRIAHIETLAILNRAHAVTSSGTYHFGLLSGAHTDLFVRVGDALASPWAISRIADWIARRLPSPALFVLDTASMIPLAQEIQSREHKDHRPLASRYVVLPLYGIDPTEAERRIAQDLSWARFSRVPVCSLLSVRATGGWQGQLERVMQNLRWVEPITTIAICETTTQPSGLAIAHLPATTVPTADNCEWCKSDGSPVIQIDAENLTSRLYVGSEQQALPNFKQLSELQPLVQLLDLHGAVRVHVDDPEERRHLGVAIDIPKLLADAAFEAPVDVALKRLTTKQSPDLVLVPAHKNSLALCSWIENRLKVPVVVVPKTGPSASADFAAIREARAILLFDECVISGRTMRGLLDRVQAIRQGGHAYWIGSLIAIARTDRPVIDRWLRDRFFISSSYALEIGWNFPLPDLDRRSCPWCVESEWLRSIMGRAENNETRALVANRLEQLRSRDGLASGIFLGASLSTAAMQVERASRTTQGAYIGNAGDAAVFAGFASAIHTIRSDWERNPNAITRRLVFPLAQALGRLTDPVIVGSILRCMRSGETDSANELRDLQTSLSSIAHSLQHPVVLGELVLASHRRTLPANSVSAHFVQNLPDPEVAAVSAMGELLDLL